MLCEIKKKLRDCVRPGYEKRYKSFFKTGKGDYGEGDFFLGIPVPEIRKVVRHNRNISLDCISLFVKSKIHEERLFGLLALVDKYEHSKLLDEHLSFFKFYCKHLQWINNWDLVDASCPKIVGQYLFENDRAILYQWAVSQNLWHRRISIVSTWWFIRNNDLLDTFNIAEILLKDKHDLIHKAVGWMLREAGKKNSFELERFIKRHYQEIPRTMLRYSIEKFPESKRKAFLSGNI